MSQFRQVIFGALGLMLTANPASAQIVGNGWMQLPTLDARHGLYNYFDIDSCEVRPTKECTLLIENANQLSGAALVQAWNICRESLIALHGGRCDNVVIRITAGVGTGVIPKFPGGYSNSGLFLINLR